MKKRSRRDNIQGEREDILNRTPKFIPGEFAWIVPTEPVSTRLMISFTKILRNNLLKETLKTVNCNESRRQIKQSAQSDITETSTSYRPTIERYFDLNNAGGKASILKHCIYRLDKEAASGSAQISQRTNSQSTRRFLHCASKYYDLQQKQQTNP